MHDTNDLRIRIASELNRALTDSFGNSGETFAAAVNREINSAIKHYESTRFRWNEVRESEWATTVAGTRNYSLPANFVRMDTLKLIYSGNYIKVHKISWDELDAMDTQSSGASRGIPTRYAVYGNIIRLFSIPQGAYTLVGSFIRRFLPTSLTGSYTSVIPMGGGYSLTVTTTASHNNRLDGWTTDGEPLIRARAKAAVRINYLKDQAAIAEMSGLTALGLAFLSIQERQSYERLAAETSDMLATGYVRGYGL